MTDALQARRLALTMLHQILRDDGQSDMVLEAGLATSTLDRRDRAFVTLLVLGVLRRLGVIDALLAQYMQSSLESKGAPEVQDVLRLGVAQLLFLDVPPHAAVHASVELVKESRFKGFAKLTNGVLQSVGRTGKEKLATLDVARLSTPDWLWQRWVRDWGKDSARRIAEWNVKEPSLDITVKSDAAGWAEKLDGILLPTGSVRLQDASGIIQREGFAEGEWWVQDAAAAIPARLLGDLTGKSVLDLCAAPGGKTAQLALAGGDVTAIDRSAPRLRRVRENLSRLGLTARVEAADILKADSNDTYDAILLDAPCSATGTIRRHPDVVMRKSEKDIKELADMQRQMLNRALGWLNPGGSLVYCVCSIEKAEGEAHIDAVLRKHPHLRLVPITADEVGGLAEIITPEGYIRTHPYHMAELGGMDGFFAAKFTKGR